MKAGSFAKGLVWLAEKWRQRGLFRFPLNRQAIFHNIIDIIAEHVIDPSQKRLVESLAYDYALCERIVPNRIPAFFNTGLETAEQIWVRETVQKKTEQIKGQGIKLQYFAAIFTTLQQAEQRSVALFLYLTQTGKKMQVEECRFSK